LRFFQQRCAHPDEMVAVDFLEGMHPDMHVSYCRRCGAVRVERDWRYIESHVAWRLPDPNLWRGK
jgi:NMD protein affecting ribosome stability and mRNA decay